jgi:hypothetical protein
VYSYDGVQDVALQSEDLDSLKFYLSPYSLRQGNMYEVRLGAFDPVGLATTSVSKFLRVTEDEIGNSFLINQSIFVRIL